MFNELLRRIKETWVGIKGTEQDEETLKREHELRKLRIEKGLAFSWTNFFKYSSIFLLGAIFVGTALLLGGLKYGSPLISSTITTPLEGNLQYLIDFETDVDFKGYFAKDKFKMLEKKNLDCIELFDYKIITPEYAPTDINSGFFNIDEYVDYQKLMDEGWKSFTIRIMRVGNMSYQEIVLRKPRGNCEYITVEKDVGSLKFIPTNLTVKNLKIKTSGAVGLNTTFSTLVDEFIKRYAERFNWELEHRWLKDA